MLVIIPPFCGQRTSYVDLKWNYLFLMLAKLFNEAATFGCCPLRATVLLRTQTAQGAHGGEIIGVI